MKTGTDVDGNGGSDQSTQGNGLEDKSSSMISPRGNINEVITSVDSAPDALVGTTVTAEVPEQDITSSSSLEKNDEDGDKDYSSDGASSSEDEALQWFGGLPRGKLESNIDGSKKKTKKSSKDERSTAASSSSSKGKGPVVGQSTPEKKGSKSEKKPKV